VKGEARKAAIAAYKERKAVPGVFVIRCHASGEAWVGEWADVASIQNRIWFSLRQGAHPSRDLLAAWKQHGEDQFQFEIVERLDEKDDAFFSPNAFLKERAAHWRKTLGAKAV
jgi:hypothetical protein